MKRALFLLLLVMLISGLSACSINMATEYDTAQDNNAFTNKVLDGVNNEINDTEKPSVSLYYEDSDIIEFYQKLGYTVKNIYTEGETVVHFVKTENEAEMMQRFEWFDRGSGRRIHAVTQQLEIRDVALTAEGRLYILTDAGFPQIMRAEKLELDGAEYYDRGYYENYIAPIENGYTFGKDAPAQLIEISNKNVEGKSGAAISFGFDGGDELFAAFSYMPLMTTEYSGKTMMVTIWNTVLSCDFEEPEIIGSVTLSSVECDGTNTVVKLLLEDIERYTVSNVYSPMTGLPCAEFEFYYSWSSTPNYPAGW